MLRSMLGLLLLCEIFGARVYADTNKAKLRRYLNEYRCGASMEGYEASNAAVNKLLNSGRSQDESLQAEVIQKSYPLVLLYFLRRSINLDVALDLAQNSFLMLHLEWGNILKAGGRVENMGFIISIAKRVLYIYINKTRDEKPAFPIEGIGGMDVIGYFDYQSSSEKLTAMWSLSMKFLGEYFSKLDPKELDFLRKYYVTPKQVGEERTGEVKDRYIAQRKAQKHIKDFGETLAIMRKDEELDRFFDAMVSYYRGIQRAREHNGEGSNVIRTRSDVEEVILTTILFHMYFLRDVQ